MVQKSYGKMRGVRKKINSSRVGATHLMKKFSMGSNVCVTYSSIAGMQHPRFHGITGKIIGTRGRSYLVSAKIGEKMKKILVRPVHLNSAG
ncbi:MAG: 50S ribosomal protein L21e [Candidatus Aenigmatarchaeota archaeon]